jgi:hypothetical protein
VACGQSYGCLKFSNFLKNQKSNVLKYDAMAQSKLTSIGLGNHPESLIKVNVFTWNWKTAFSFKNRAKQ